MAKVVVVIVMILMVHMSTRNASVMFHRVSALLAYENANLDQNCRSTDQRKIIINDVNIFVLLPSQVIESISFGAVVAKIAVRLEDRFFA